MFFLNQIALEVIVVVRLLHINFGFESILRREEKTDIFRWVSTVFKELHEKFLKCVIALEERGKRNQSIIRHNFHKWKYALFGWVTQQYSARLFPESVRNFHRR